LPLAPREVDTPFVLAGALPPRRRSARNIRSVIDQRSPTGRRQLDFEEVQLPRVQIDARGLVAKFPPFPRRNHTFALAFGTWRAAVAASRALARNKLVGRDAVEVGHDGRRQIG